MLWSRSVVNMNHLISLHLISVVVDGTEGKFGKNTLITDAFIVRKKFHYVFVNKSKYAISSMEFRGFVRDKK